MHPPSIKIITSPPGVTSPLPPRGSAPTPTKLAPPTIQYRIEERRRTVYVTSEVHPSQWSAETVNDIFKLADIPEGTGETGEQNVRRTKSLSEREVLVIAEDGNSSNQVVNNVRKASSSPSSTRYRPKRPASSETTSSVQHSKINHPTPPSTPIRGSSHTPSPIRHRILFYHKHDPHYGFTNFSPHPVTYKGKRYPTSEHLFQSFKFQEHRPNLAEHIRTCSERPSVAFSEARRFQPEVRPDWKQVNIEKMDETLWYKFTQNLDLQQELLSTGDSELIEDSDKDAFWGVGADRRGRNELGKALERLRAVLREAS